MAAAAPKPAPSRQKRALGDRVEFVFDPTRYDGASKELFVPVRLRNTSKEPIDPPIIPFLRLHLDDVEDGRKGFFTAGLQQPKAQRGSGGLQLEVPEALLQSVDELLGTLSLHAATAVSPAPRSDQARSTLANDAGISQRVVACKSELEKIREQVQNLE